MLNNAEDQYLEIMKDILENGTTQGDRTGTGTKKVFGRTIRHDMKNGFPLLTTKKMHIKSIVGELIWFLKGTEDAQYLIDNEITIWDEWMQDVMIPPDEACYVPTPSGKKILPHTYGVKWRDFDGVDQIAAVLESLRKNPMSRRHIVSAWDPRHIGDTALPWCHVMFQFNVRPSNKIDSIKRTLDISVYQRSCDWFLGVPFNLASYGFLLNMIAQQVDMIPGEMIYNFGDSHIYLNHQNQVKKQLHRIPYRAPVLNLKKKSSIDDYDIEDFSIERYECHPRIKAPVAV